MRLLEFDQRLRKRWKIFLSSPLQFSSATHNIISLFCCCFVQEKNKSFVSSSLDTRGKKQLVKIEDYSVVITHNHPFISREYTLCVFLNIFIFSSSMFFFLQLFLMTSPRKTNKLGIIACDLFCHLWKNNLRKSFYAGGV